MIRTNSERFFRCIRHDKKGVSFPLEDKHIVNEHHVIRKSHDATEKKMSSRGAFQCTTWWVSNKLAASKTLLWTRQKNSWVSRSTGNCNTNAIVSNLSRDNILFSTFYTGLFLLFRKKTGGGQAPTPPGPLPLLRHCCLVFVANISLY